MNKLTPEIVVAYHEHMAKKFGAHIITKEDAAEMRAIDYALDVMGIKKKGWFLSHHAMALGNRIYIHWRPGVGGYDDLLYQVFVLVEEIVHKNQWQDDRRFAWRYISSKAHRARFEAEAKRASLEVYYALTGRTLCVDRLCRPLKNYRLRRADIKRVRRDLEIYNTMVARGMVGTKEGREAIRWLKKALK